MSKLIPAILAVSLIASCTNAGRTIEEEPMPPIGFRAENYSGDTITVKSGEVFTSVMYRFGLAPSTVSKLIAMSDSLFDVRKFRAGNEMCVYYSKDSIHRAEYVTYRHDKIRTTVFQCGDSLAVWDWVKPVTKERKYTDVTISTSLWNDMIAANASPTLIMDLADIYQWSVNFFALQQGDRFRIIYSQSVCDGEVVSIDTVHFSLFNSGSVEVPAVRFSPDGKRYEYWGKNGESLKKMFLKAPLRYNRISSRFTLHRKHPVTGKVRPHTAVDYAAPTGTPVHAIGNGTVSLCGWDGSGGGNRIKIKHTQGYESCYMHLSKFAKGIKSGTRVTQGQLIGYVGSTGRSTGPHLDFRIWHKGKPINPLTLNSPSSEPLPKKYLEDFNLLYNKYMEEIDRTKSN